MWRSSGSHWPDRNERLAVGQKLGLKDSRNVRNWQMLKESTSRSSIPYAAWALLCYFAGLGLIFIDNKTDV